MPTYEYKCKLCQHQLELVQSMLDEPKTECPVCNKPGLQRLISKNVGISFKGGGFYVTDSTKKGKQTTTSSPST